MKIPKNIFNFILFNLIIVTSLNAQRKDDLTIQMNNLSGELKNCNPKDFAGFVDKRRDILLKIDAVSDINRYTREIISMDDYFLGCAKTIIENANEAKKQTTAPQDTLIKIKTVIQYVDTCPEQVKCPDPIICPDPIKCPDPIICPDQASCTKQITYVAVGSGAALLLLLLALLNALKAKKWMEEIFNKLHDEIMDYIMKRLLAVANLGDDEKFRKKVEKLRDLNQQRKYENITVKQYLVKVDEVLAE